MADGFRFLVGIDWATEQHQVCVMNGNCDVIAERVIEHTGRAIAQFLDWLAELVQGDPGGIGVAIEIPRGALVEGLVERGFAVFAINPKQLDRFRDRHTVAGAKDDRRDAFVLADSLRTDQHLFKRVRVDDPLIMRLRDLSRCDDELRQDLNRAQNQFREQLQRFYPALRPLCPAADEPWLWALFEAAPLPAAAAQLRPQRIEKLLRAHRIRRWTVEQVREALRSTPFPLAPGAAEAAAEHALLLLPHLRLLHEQRHQVAERIQSVLDQLGQPDSSKDDPRQHRDVTLLLSLPGVGRVIAATMLAEAAQPLADRDYHALRSYSGVAPITKKSGKKRSVLMRQACNQRMRHALYHWARVSTQIEERSRRQYEQLRGKGHSHGRALRGVADRLLAMLVAILNTGVPYNPDLRNIASTPTVS
jgi:transposase